MNALVLNEKKYIEEQLSSGEFKANIPAILPMLARYCRHEYKMKIKEVRDALEIIMATYYENYNPVKWSSSLDKYARNSSRRGLLEIESIPITQAELAYISDIKNIRIERLMFTLLCLAKYYNARNETNNNWTNLATKYVFKLARVSTTVDEQNYFVRDLYIMGLVSYSKKIDNLNLQVNFIDNDNVAVLEISDFRELGYEYMQWKQGGYFRCEHCGILVRQNKNGTRKYCKDCIGYQPIETKTIVCIDCGKEFEVDGIVKNKTRCSLCQRDRDKKMNKARVNSFRNKAL